MHEQYEAQQKVKAVTAQPAYQAELFKKEQAIQAKEGEISRLKEQDGRAGRPAETGRGNGRRRQERGECEPERLHHPTPLLGPAGRKEAALHEDAVRQEYEAKLKVAQEQVDYYKDLKSKLSTKMVGETLEAHCSNVFNEEMRPMSPEAYFEKDNDVSGGTKGDFVFRDSVDGTEYISIMFEMKNESDETATKHKNEEFFKKLDADRNAKGCEYAVLVSLLEPDRDLYNGGIVDVSHRYPKMYVIRPQFFRALIMLLANAARKTVGLKKELELALRQSADVTHFEEQLLDFKDKFTKNVLDRRTATTTPSTVLTRPSSPWRRSRRASAFSPAT